MSTFKPDLESQHVTTVLKQHFADVSHVQPVSDGYTSQAFFAVADNAEYVVRFATLPDNFRRDAYAYRTFASPHVPIPQVIALAEHNGLHYAITRRATGVTVDKLTPTAYAHIVPALIGTLDALHTADVSASRGYGYWDTAGNGIFDSWQAYVMHVTDPDQTGFWQGWQRLYTDSFLERDRVERLSEQMAALITYVPEERYLIHCDYGRDNVVSDGTKITGVLDWGNAGYGDYLYDVAWLSFWRLQYDYGDLFQRHYATQNVAHYAERMRCYHLHIALAELRFYAFVGQKATYEWLRGYIETIL